LASYHWGRIGGDKRAVFKPQPSEGKRRTDVADAARLERDDVMTKTDCLIEVAKKLKEARTLAESTSDRVLLYFIDMTIVHVCDSLTSRSESQGPAEGRLSPIHAAA
jgi:hypothetical protein